MRDHENDWWTRWHLKALRRISNTIDAREGRPATAGELAEVLDRVADILPNAERRFRGETT